MTVEQILNDIKTDRVKKCILDSDMANEMDDQYALAYCIGCDKIDLLSVNAAPFTYEDSFALGVKRSYDETIRILEACGKNDGSIPVYMGCERRFTSEDNFAPIDSPAVRNIIDTAHSLDETLYIFATGCCTNVASACLIDPSIKDKICVIWLGANCLDFKNEYEYNLLQDFDAGRILLNCKVPLILLPAISYDEKCGTQVLKVSFEDLKKISGDGKTQQFFRWDFPLEFLEKELTQENIDNWRWIIWDLAAPGVVSVPEAYTFHVMPTPTITDDKLYAFDKTRHNMIYMERLDKDIVLNDTFESIKKI